MRRAPISLLAILAAAVHGSCRTAPGSLGAPGAARGYDLLLVTLDTTRADRLGCYGHAEAATPVLDALAAEGARFADAVTVAPVTLPAHASIMTGLYPPAHGVRNNGEYRLHDAQVTLAERLREADYDTAAFVSAFVLDGRYGLGQGFDRFDDRTAAPAGAGFPAGTTERDARDVTDAAIAWLRGRDRSRPGFTWVHYFDPHAPYEAHDGGPRHPYDGEIAHVDRELGRLLLAAREAGRGRLLVVVVGDHGESLGEHGEETHSLFVYDAVLRVPLIVAAPGVVDAGRVVREQVSTVDLAPTLLDLLGLPPMARCDGTSMAAALPPEDRAVYFESTVPLHDFGWAPLSGLRLGKGKYIKAPSPELYDLPRDPGELRNMWGRGDLAALRDDLAARLRSLEHGWPSESEAAASAEAPSAEERSRLEALGYVGGGAERGPGALADPKEKVPITTAILKANAALSSGRPQQALEAIEGVPEDPATLYLRAKIHLALGRLGDAEAALLALDERRPRADALLLLGQIRILDGRLGEAAALLDEAEALDPRHGGIFIARGDLLLSLGSPEEAAASYREAMKLDPYRAKALAEERLARLLRPGSASR